MKLSCIDVFSGIGGISYALKEFVSTVQYCEWDSYCQTVLFERMRNGDLDKAPIHSDIKTLFMPEASAPKMICGGFPCQDISSLGLQKGIIDGERSSMFYEVMRLVDECPSISVVFLENVANILHCGMQEVITELSKRGWSFQWTIKSAGSFGAPHVRARWFCLGLKHGEDVTDLVDICKTIQLPKLGDWKTEEFPRYTFKPEFKEDSAFDPLWIQRCQTLGNSVVPMVVREAFMELVQQSQKWHHVAEFLKGSAIKLSDVKYPYPENGLVVASEIFELPRKTTAAEHHNIHISLMKDGQVIEMHNFPTPRRGMTHASSLTDRSLRDLPTILVCCEQTVEDLKVKNIETDPNAKPHMYLLPNVNYIEWMMGYPKDWTKVSEYRKKPKEKEVTGECMDVCEEYKTVISPKKKNQIHWNGMHMLMKEHPGKDIKRVAEIWRSLSDEDKAKFKLMAQNYQG